MRPDISAETDDEHAAVLVVHRHKVGKELQTRCLGAGTFIIGLVESPELLGIVPAKEVRVVLEEVFKREEVVVLNVGVSSTRWLAGEPNVVGAADRCP